MRFLMLNWRCPRNPLAGGAERVTEAYLAALAARGHEVFWFANTCPGAPTEEEMSGIRLRRESTVGRSVLAARRWYRQQRRFDLVIDQHHGIPWYAPWWSGTRCISYVHEVLGPIWDTFYRWPWNWVGRRQERWTHWMYARVPFWTACESTREGLRRHGAQRITIIRYGVHTRALPELEAKPLGVPLRLAVVSRLAPNKRVDHCLRALAVLRARGVEARLTVVGRGDMDDALRQLAAALGLGSAVRFAGLLSEPDKDGVLRDAHCLLHTSVREGWGLNVIEANAMGTPAVVYPVPGLVESTLDDRTGVVVRAETPESLADALERLVGDAARYQRYRRAAWERAQALHWDRILPAACDWLESQARGDGPHGVVIPQ